MIVINNSLIDLLHCQQKTQNETLQVIHQSQRDHANDSLIDDISTFHGKPELYFHWILMLENIAAVTKCNPKELALGEAQCAVIKCL